MSFQRLRKMSAASSPRIDRAKNPRQITLKFAAKDEAISLLRHGTFSDDGIGIPKRDIDLL